MPQIRKRPFQIITSTEEFISLCDSLSTVERYALDTEFHREQTYYPELALLQIAWDSTIVLVDPLQVNISYFAKVLQSDAVAVLHAAEQDIEILEHYCGTYPKQLFDTQLAAGFLGHSNISLRALHEKAINIYLSKENRITNWLQRPLTESQQRYAANDVSYLLEIHEWLVKKLHNRNRLFWAEEENRFLLEQKLQSKKASLQAWQRVGGIRQLSSPKRERAELLANWREETAKRVNKPVRHVLSDLGLLGIAQNFPQTPEELLSIRGITEKHLPLDTIREILDILQAPQIVSPHVSHGDPIVLQDKELRSLVILLSAWVSQQSKDLSIDTALLATRHDIEMFLQENRSGKLSSGWRFDLLGKPLLDILEGNAALTIGDKGKIVLEARSHTPWIP